MNQRGQVALPLHLRFRQQATRREAAVAVKDAGSRYTYGELLAAAESVRRAIEARGVRPGDRVAVSLPRGFDYLAASFGVLAAGAACVPLNPTDPPSRHAQVLRDVAAAAVVAGASSGVPDGVAFVRVPLAPAPDGRVGAWRDGGETDAAFAFATSGSTGKPKVSVLSHRAINVGLDWARHELSLGDDDCTLFRTSPNFVSILRQAFWVLAEGGRCITLAPGEEQNLRKVVALIADEGVTVTTFMPSALRVALQSVQPGSNPQLKHILCGAEPLEEALRREVASRFGDAQLHNLFASTEAPLITHHRCAPHDRGTSPVGTPVPGMRMHLVTPSGRIAEPGEEGESYVGGRGLFDGYLTSTGLDTGRFVADRWEGGTRLYPTGDVLRAGASPGLSVYIARRSGFVKVRGHRIVPGDIESTLLRLPSVAETAVVPVDRDHGTVLHAFYSGDARPSAADVRQFLARELPSGHVPDRLFSVDALPHLPNGKVDRAALDVAALANGDRGDHPQPAGLVTAQHEGVGVDDLVCAMVEDILGLPRVAPTEDLSALGLDSLSRVELETRVADVLGVDLDPATVTGAVDAREIALAARALRADQTAGGVPPADQSRELHAARPDPVAVATTTYWSRARSTEVSYTVARPAEAANGGRGRSSPPVVLLLHGKGGDHRFAFRALDADRVLAELAGGFSRRLAVVSVDGGDSCWHPRACGDDPDAMIFEEVLPRLQEQGLATDQVGIIGWSTGGLGALLTAARRPDRIAAAVAVSAALWQDFHDTPDFAFDGQQDFEEKNPLFHTPDVRVPTWLYCGADDPFSAANQSLRDRLASELVTYTSLPGGHTWGFWRRGLRPQLQFVAGHLP